MLDLEHICYDWRTFFRQAVGNQIGTYCAPLFPDFIQELLRKKDKKLAIIFNFTFRYMNDVLSLNNSPIERIYPIEREIKDTTDTVKSASYFD